MRLRLCNLAGETSAKRGFVLVELVVAMIIATVVAATVLGFWKGFNIHIIEQNRKALLRQELSRISRSLTRQVQQSEGLISWNSNELILAKAGKEDTIVYEYYADRLTKNGVPVSLISNRAYISYFAISKVESDVADDPEQPLISCSIAVADSFGNRDTVVSLITIRLIAPENASSSEWY